MCHCSESEVSGIKTKISTDLSVIAQLVFASNPNLNFSNLVAELDSVLERINCVERRLNLQKDDIAIFDMPGTRIILALIDAPREGVAKSLTVSFGPDANTAEVRSQIANHTVLCERLVERLRKRLRPDDILWQHYIAIEQLDVTDSTAATLPFKSKPKRAIHHPIFASVTELTIEEILNRKIDRPRFSALGATGQKVLPAVLPEGPPAGANLDAQNDMTEPHNSTVDSDLCRLRAALYPQDDMATAQSRDLFKMQRVVTKLNATLNSITANSRVASAGQALIKGRSLRASGPRIMATAIWRSDPQVYAGH